MSTTYTDLPNTQYPDAIDVFDNKTDATADMQPYITQYKNYFNAGNVAAARNLLETFPQLKNMIISANDLNKLQDAMMAMERFVKRTQQQIIFSRTEPSGANTQAVGDVWIKITENGNEMYELTTSGYALRMGADVPKLKTARLIGNAAFDGTKDITLAQMGAATAAQGRLADTAMQKASFQWDASTKTLNIIL